MNNPLFHKNNNINSYLNLHSPSWDVRNCSYGHHIDTSDETRSTCPTSVFTGTGQSDKR